MEVLDQCQTVIVQLPARSWLYEWLYALHLFYRPIHTYVSIVLCAVGAVCNFCTIVVLTRKQMRTPVNLILTAMACCDTVVLFSNLIYTTHYTFVAFANCLPRHWSYGWALFLIAHAHLSLVGHSSSVWLSVMLALIRYLTLRRRGRLTGIHIELHHSYAAIAAVVFFVSLMNAPNFLTYKIIEQPLNMTCVVTDKRHQSAYAYVPGVSDMAVEADCLVFRMAFWISGTVFKLLPCMLLTLLVSLLTRILNEVAQNRQKLLNNRLAAGCSPNFSPSSAIHHHHHPPQTNNYSGTTTTANHHYPRATNGSLATTTSEQCNLLMPPVAPSAVVVGSPPSPALGSGYQLLLQAASTTDYEHSSSTTGGCYASGSPATDQSPPQSAASAATAARNRSLRKKYSPMLLVSASPPLPRNASLRGSGDAASLGKPLRQQRRGTDRTTRMLLTIVVVLLVTELPQGVMAVLSGMFSEEFRRYIYNNVGDLLDLLSLFGACTSFIIYCSMSGQFRMEFRRVFLPRRLKHCLWFGRYYGTTSFRHCNNNNHHHHHHAGGGGASNCELWQKSHPVTQLELIASEMHSNSVLHNSSNSSAGVTATQQQHRRRSSNLTNESMSNEPPPPPPLGIMVAESNSSSSRDHHSAAATTPTRDHCILAHRFPPPRTSELQQQSATAVTAAGGAVERNGGDEGGVEYGGVRRRDEEEHCGGGEVCENPQVNFCNEVQKCGQENAPAKRRMPPKRVDSSDGKKLVESKSSSPTTSQDQQEQRALSSSSALEDYSSQASTYPPHHRTDHNDHDLNDGDEDSVEEAGGGEEILIPKEMAGNDAAAAAADNILLLLNSNGREKGGSPPRIVLRQQQHNNNSRNGLGKPNFFAAANGVANAKASNNSNSSFDDEQLLLSSRGGRRLEANTINNNNNSCIAAKELEIMVGDHGRKRKKSKRRSIGMWLMEERAANLLRRFGQASLG